jgi:hypothetical protein
MMYPSRATRPQSHPVATATPEPELPVSMLESEAYRPRGSLAIGMLVLPVIGVLGLLAAALILRTAEEMLAEILLGVSGAVAIIWIALLFGLARVLLTTVRASGEGIEARTPWDERKLLRWKYVELVERKFGFLRLQTSDGGSLLLLESSLTNGQRLLRQILLRVSPSVLSLPLQQELTLLGGGPMNPDVTQSLTLSPWWFFLPGGIALAAVGLVLSGVFTHLLVLLIIGLLLYLPCMVLLYFLRQTIALTDEGVTVTRGLGQPQTVAWAEIAVIEQMPLEMVMAFRTNTRRIVFFGPFFMSPLRAGLWQGTIEDRLISQGILVYERWRVF